WYDYHYFLLLFLQAMERFEIVITVLLVVLVMICVYIAASWTLWRKHKNKSPVEEWLDNGVEDSSAFRRGFIPEGEEGLPKITITPIQPRLDISEGSSAPVTDIEDDIDHDGCDSQEVDLGRLYFALQYDQQRAVLFVRLIRGEDIPMERDISATYVGVRLLPLRLQGEQIEPYETSINVSFQECYEFHLAQSELAHQTLDFHICRYDRFSRKVAIGDVYLALAELGAQGIDITKEVYLCRNLIHSREAAESSPQKVNAKSMWQMVQAAVLKGKFRGISQSLAGQDSPFYWESMFSSGGEGENVESSPAKLAKMFYFSSGPGPPEEHKEEDGDDEEINVEDVVRKGERSGSFLFPSKRSDDEDEDDEGDEVAKALPSPLQISPAPEEYYRLVPFTPYTPASPLKNQNSRDPNVSWRVPESFSSRGPDVVQTLSDIYSDPRIVTTANLRQTTGRRLPAQATSADSDRGRRPAKGKTGDYSRTKKRRRQEARTMPSPAGGRQVTKAVKRHKRKRSSGKLVDHKGTPDQDSSTTKPQKLHSTKRVFKIKPQNARTLSSSSEEEIESKSKKKGKKQSFAKRETEAHSSSATPRESTLVFEAKDFKASCMYPLKDRAQSAPNVTRESPSTGRHGAGKRTSRPSVSMSDVKDSHIDSSDVSTDFEQY
ncbi:hypothetical protein QZH41_011261, partial [Actinostola sp. cb2023]